MKVLIKKESQIDWVKYRGYSRQHCKNLFGNVFEAEKEKFSYTVITELGIEVYVPGFWIMKEE